MSQIYVHQKNEYNDVVFVCHFVNSHLLYVRYTKEAKHQMRRNMHSAQYYLTWTIVLIFFTCYTFSIQYSIHKHTN